MKKLFIRPILLCLLFFAPLALLAQQVIRQQSCNDAMISQQVDSIKQMMAVDGYSVMREASMMMESEYEMPVIMELNEKVPYRFVFVGDASSRLYEVRMYDFDEKEVAYVQNRKGDDHANVIIYSYVPRFTEMHMMKPVQVNKQKKTGLCGYVLLFRRNPMVRRQ